MHDAALVRIGEGPPDFAPDPANGLGGQGAGSPQTVGERLTRHVPHDEPRQIARLGDFVDGHDVRMKALRGDARFAEEAMAHVLAPAERRREQLDGDRALQQHVTREIHDAHAAAPQFCFERKTAGDGLLQGEKRWIGGSGGHGRHYGVVRRPGFGRVRIRDASSP